MKIIPRLRAGHDGCEKRPRHSARQSRAQVIGNLRAAIEIIPKSPQKAPPSLLQANDRIRFVVRQQPSADIERRGRTNLAVVDQTYFGRAAADIDVEQDQTLLAALHHSTRAMRRHNGFQGRARGRADEASGLVGKQLGDLLRIFAPRRFAGDDHRAGIDILARQSSLPERGVDKFPERLCFDIPIAAKRCEQNR